MFQSGVNRKRDSKSLDACFRIEVLLGTNGDRPGNNSFRSVPTSLLFFLKFRGDPFSLCTYTRKYIQDFFQIFLQNNNFFFQTQGYQIGHGSIETLKNAAGTKLFS